MWLCRQNVSRVLIFNQKLDRRDIEFYNRRLSYNYQSISRYYKIYIFKGILVFYLYVVCIMRYKIFSIMVYMHSYHII